MDSIDVTFDLGTLHCFDEGDGSGNAEPYLWTVFFKVDGDSVRVNDQLMLEGTATVVTTPGNHGDLPVGGDGIDAGQSVGIPASLGHFRSTLRPIRTPLAGKFVGGMIGCIGVLLEEDSTPDAAIAAGHAALNKAVRDQINALIPTLGFTNPTVSDDAIAALESKISGAITSAVSDNVGFWDVLGSLFGNLQDDKIGIAKFMFTHDALEKKAGTTIPISQTWANEGSWKLDGKVRVDKPLVAGICRSGNWANRFLFGLDTKSFIAQNQKLFDEQGFRLVHLETWNDNGVRRWASIHRPGDWAHRLVVGLDTNAFITTTQSLFDDRGLRLERMVNWIENGQVRWAGSYRSGTWAHRLVVGLDLTAFSQKTQTLFDTKGLRLEQAITYVEGGQRHWAGIYRSGDWGHRFFVSNDRTSFVKQTQKFFDEDGLRIIDFESWIEGGARRYAGISRSGTWANRLVLDEGMETFQQHAQQLFVEKGLRLENVDVYA
jgi:hypothetical protein